VSGISSKTASQGGHHHDGYDSARWNLEKKMHRFVGLRRPAIRGALVAIEALIDDAVAENVRPDDSLNMLIESATR